VVGVVARMIFYMATRYEGENGEPNLEIIDYIPADNNSTEPLFAKLSDLLAWNAQDPVDDFERNRNEVVYSYQHNRNPFIDHPEYVNMIWGGNSSPVFTNVATIPAEPTETDNVQVTAEITDADGISSVTFNWGTSSGNLANSITMSLVSGSQYTTTTTIPAQPNGTTVYYKLTVIDQLSQSASSAIRSYHLSSGNEGTPVTLFSDDFNDGTLNKWNAQSVTGAQIWSIHNTYGINSTPCARMTGYTTVNNANEDWLITPAISLAGVPDAILSFYSACGYTGANIEVKYSTDYPGSGDPSTYTWTNFSGYALSTGSFTWVASGNVSLSALHDQTVYVAFIYYSTTSASKLWELDDISIAGTYYTGDYLAPELSVFPANGSVNESLIPNIYFTSTESLFNPQYETITTGYLHSVISFTKGDAQGDDVPFSITIGPNDTVFTVIPSNNLDYGTDYYISLPGNSLGDETGNLVSTDISTHFKTLPAPDTIPPVLSIIPSDNSLQIPINQNIIIKSDSALFKPNGDVPDAEYLKSAIIFKKDNQTGDDIPFTLFVDESYDSLVVTPSNPYNYNTVYFFSIKGGMLADNKGNVMEEPVALSFTTITEPDLTAPVLLSSALAADWRTIKMVFDEPISNTTGHLKDSILFSENALVFKHLGTNDEIEIDDSVLKIIFTNPLIRRQNQVKILPFAVSDTSGNAIATTLYSAVFDASGSDSLPPVLTKSVLENDWKTIQFTFSEPIKDFSGHLSDSILFSTNGTVFNALPANTDLIIHDSVLQVQFAAMLDAPVNQLKIKANSISDTLNNPVQIAIMSPVFDATGSDTQAPVFATGYPFTDSISSGSAIMVCKINEPGLVYYTLKLKTETAPTKAQVLAGPSVQLTTSDAVQKVYFDGLTDFTQYVVYLLLQDKHPVPNTSNFLTKLNFSTLAKGPGITQQDSSLLLCEGDQAILHVEAGGTNPLTFRWFFDGYELAGINAPEINLGLANEQIQGNYLCIVSNMAGSDTSAIIPVVVNHIPFVGSDMAVSVKDTGSVFSVNELLNNGVDTNGTWLCDSCPNDCFDGTLFNPALAGDGTYHLTYQLENECGISTAILIINVESTVGIANNPLQNLQIWPNPTKGFFHIKTTQNTKVEVRIFQVDGSVVYHGNIDAPTDLELQLNEPGIYFIELKQSGYKTVSKLIVE